MDLNRVATFIQVVEAGTFTGAARHLGLPPSSVSRSVAKLERDLGIVLLERTTRQVSLTDAGRAYFERAREAVAGLNEATALAGEAALEPSGIVHLAAPPEMVGKLAAAIGSFVRRHPKIHVEVMTTARGAELVGAEIDLAIVHGRLEDSSLIVTRLGVTLYRLYASPAYIEQRGRPRNVAELANHDVVLHRGNGGRATWELSGPRGLETVEVRGLLSGDSFQFVLDAVSGGYGIGLMPEQCVAHRESSALIHLLPKYSTPAAVQSLLYPSKHLPKRVKLLRDFLVTELMSQCKVASQRP